MNQDWPRLLGSLVRRNHLDADSARWAMSEILSGNASAVQIAAFVVALRTKGETVEEVTGLADAMLASATPVCLPREALDIVGSGGDRANTVNVSTMAAVVAAAAGVPVVKHGNRAASSKCGTADVLEAIGVALDVPASAQPGVLERAGITFLFAPMYHPALRHAAGARRELGIQTTFNFLGPLANPARPRANAVGVADAAMAPLVAGVLAGRGAHGLVFHGGDGLDELTTTTASAVWLIRDGQVSRDHIDPSRLGLRLAQPGELTGGDAAHNAQVVWEVLRGRPGPVRDIVVLNAAAGLVAYAGPEPGERLEDQLAEALGRAAEAIDSGAGEATLARWVEVSQSMR
ncbi:MAG: anthranilate phosphoribosyltransferase [Propionibacteriaceae bacterium]|nr:anthranilate phosphoribosyltransferase [Propionibacteriaceae bacterium]